MKILITGAGGNLGRVVVPALVEQGHTPRLMDFRPLDTPYEYVQADVRDLDQMRRAVAGLDAIIHAAALHGIHLRQWPPQDFWAIKWSVPSFGGGTEHARSSCAGSPRVFAGVHPAGR